MIKLYLCDISNFIEEVNRNERFMDGFFDKIGTGRKNYILNHKKAEDKARSLCVSCLLLFALKKEIPNLKILPEFDYLPDGKPFLKKYPEIFFNLSHSGNIITCVISDKEVGVDVEHMRSFNEKISGRIFTDGEKKIAKGEEKNYLRFWTMKEACAKLRGSGLRDIFDGEEVLKEQDGFIVKKLNQDIRKTSCAYVVTEGYTTDCEKGSYFYSVCADVKDKSQTYTVPLFHIFENYDSVESSSSVIAALAADEVADTAMTTANKTIKNNPPSTSHII